VTKADAKQAADISRRERIANAAGCLFVERGYAGVSTREIATAAKVSKRELYALFENKQAILVACITGRIASLNTPATLPAVSDRASCARVLDVFGANTLRRLIDPNVLAIYRLAIVEYANAPEIARTIDANGRVPLRHALGEWMRATQSAGLLDAGDPDAMAEQFFALLLGERRLRIIMGVAPSLTEDEITQRATMASEAFLRLHLVRR
jgi:AcrR family transcriptional regulator